MVGGALMKALLSTIPGGPGTLELRDVPIPDPAAGELRVRVLACAINYPDVLIIEDRYQFKPPRPFSPGVELCGVVDEIGKDEEGWHRGAVLLATCSHGGLAENCVVAAGNAFRLPANKDPAEGADRKSTSMNASHECATRMPYST